MKVIFQQDVRGQGKKGEMKEVSEGYGRNYLLPRGLAVEANKDNLNTLALKEKARKAQEARERAEAEEAAAKLKDVIVTVRAKAGANGRLFGSVTSQEITAGGAAAGQAATAPCSCSSSKSKSGWKNCSDGGCPGPRKRNRRCSARA